MIRFFWILTFLCASQCEAKTPNLTANDVTAKATEIMKAHASHKKLTPQLAQRLLNNYLDTIDPNKTYFVESDIAQWIDAPKELVDKLIADYENHQFVIFEEINKVLVKAIERKQAFESRIDYTNLPKHVKVEEFKDIPWAKNEDELIERYRKIRALQLETASKLSEEMKEKSLQRIVKRQMRYENDALHSTPEESQRLVLSNVLKATASSLDSHTAYFTPEEASQFMIGVQQRLFGIGAQLRDDINGFTVVKLVEGGPAAMGKELKAKDLIIAVDGEPVVGMDIGDAVDLIRGDENTLVVLTVIRTETLQDGTKEEKKLEIPITRNKVILKESRFKSSYTPFGDGAIGYLRLYSFYQDKENSSAADLRDEIKKLKNEHHLLGLILDLRFNSGGLLSQAVNVTGLFITKGIVVSIKDENGHVQHLRALGGDMTWDGPLIVLVNRASASASEIVAQTLQDYGRAVIIGDDHTYGKGSYQTFTLSADDREGVNQKGEYKVTRGRYYTVSGETPQLNGVISDIVVPGALSESEIGERFAKYPLEHDHIKSNFDDDLSDIPFLQRDKIRRLYKFGLQEKLDTYQPYIEGLKKNSTSRVESSQNYQNFLSEVKKKDTTDLDEMEPFGQNDLQLEESYDVMKDLLILMQEKGVPLPAPRSEIISLFTPLQF